MMNGQHTRWSADISLPPTGTPATPAVGGMSLDAIVVVGAMVLVVGIVLGLRLLARRRTR